MPYGSKLAASRSTVVVPSPISVSSPPMIPASAIARSASAITRSSATSSRSTPSSVVSFSPGRARRTTIRPPWRRREVEGVQRVPEREHHVVRDVDDVRDRPLAGEEEARAQPLRRRPRSHVLEQVPDVARAARRSRRSAISTVPSGRAGDCPRSRPEEAGRRGSRSRARGRRRTGGRAGCPSPRRRARASASGSTSESGVPGSVSGRSMIPAWSAPRRPRPRRGSSRPRPGRAPRGGSSSRPFGSRAPGSATPTVAPTPKFQAPQTIERGSPSPTSTFVICRRSAFGCFSASSTRPILNRPRLPSSSATPRRLDRLDLGGRDESRVASSVERHLDRRRSRAARRPGRASELPLSKLTQHA